MNDLTCWRLICLWCVFLWQEFFKLDTDEEKMGKLAEILSSLPGGVWKAVVFVNTKRRCEHLCSLIYNQGFRASAIHGDKTQAERDLALSKFKANKGKTILFATDVAARGLDIKGKPIPIDLSFSLSFAVHSYWMAHLVGRMDRIPGVIASDSGVCRNRLASASLLTSPAGGAPLLNE